MDADDPVGRARQALGEQLAALRRAAGYSQHAFAQRIDGYGRSTVANVERGRQNVASDFWRRADAALGTDGTLVRGHDRLSDLVRAARTDAARSAGDRYAALIGGGRPDLEPRSGGTAHPPGVASAQAMSRAFRAADRQVGGRYLYPSVIRYLRSDIGPAIVAAPRRHATDMLRAAASFECMAGWMAHDAGRNDLAGGHFRHALRLARAAEDTTLLIDILAGLSHLALRSGDPREARRFAQAGLDRLKTGQTGRLGARLTVLDARGKACLGDAAGARRSLGVAVDLLDAAARDRPGWLGLFDHGSMAADAAACLRELGDLRGAKRHAEEALRLRSGDRARSRTLALISLSTLHVLDRDVDAGCAVAIEALACAQDVSSALVSADFGQLQAALRPHGGIPDVRDLLARIRLACTMSS